MKYNINKLIKNLNYEMSKIGSNVRFERSKTGFYTIDIILGKDIFIQNCNITLSDNFYTVLDDICKNLGVKGTVRYNYKKLSFTYYLDKENCSLTDSCS